MAPRPETAEIVPGLVSRALQDIDRAYESDSGRADALLDQLIVFLRAAIPRIRPMPSAGKEKVEAT